MRAPSMLASCLATSILAVALLPTALGKAVDLTSTKDFDAFVALKQPALLEFFAPWCGHCKKLAPTYDELAAAFGNDGKASATTKVTIAKIDADKNRDLGNRFAIKGFPTLKWFDGKDIDKLEDYGGARDLDTLAKFVEEKTGKKSNIKLPPPPVAVQLGRDNFDRIVLDDSKHVLVEFYAPWCGHCQKLAPIYEQVAKDFENEEDVVVAQMNANDPANNDIAVKHGVSSYPTIVFFSKDNKEGVLYQGGRDEDSFVKFLNDKASTFRTAGGKLSELAGRLPILDSIATRFFNAPLGEKRRDIVFEALNMLEDLKKRPNTTKAKEAAADYYMKVMDKVTLNPSYVEKETKRLSTLLSKHTSGAAALASSKVDEITRKVNVLGAFRKIPEENLKRLEEVAKQAKEKMQQAAKEAGMKEPSTAEKVQNSAEEAAQQVKEKVVGHAHEEL
ncbi:Thioredoxin/protein disulfide isomerase [Ceraceosorus bombacis]|uniref:protein disulfide-isomerase n=1 Tax=Ceraceosorus bombacis TaxID=401625 RepID=A0A0P1BMM4_9BASI|nr:Thioredoxin/protein disulfide isomerase [Ceraceosorus bombacis]